MIVRCHLEWHSKYVGIALKKQELQASEQHIYNISYCNTEETIGRSASPRPTQCRSSGGTHASVEEPTHQWNPCWWMSPCADGGACAPVEPAHQWRSSHAGGAMSRCRSPLAGTPFSGGTGVEGPVADLGSGGAVEDVGTPPLLSWSRGTRPVPEDAVSTMMVLADDGGLDSPPMCRSPKGWMWKRRQRIMGREEPWRMGDACGRCGRRWLGGTLAH
jgi:hypothetical protein